MFCVTDLLKMDILNNVKVICGKNGLHHQITGVTIIEAPDIAKFVNGGEVLLTSLYAFKDCTADECNSYMSPLSQKNVSAVVIKSGRVTSGAALEALRRLCEQSEIPLMEVPFELPFRSIMYPIMERLFNAEVTQLKYFKATHDNFLSLSVLGNDNGYENILSALEHLIGNPAALFDRAFRCIATTNQDLNKLYMPTDVSPISTILYAKYEYFKQCVSDGNQKNCMQYIVPIDLMFHQKMYLAITETDRPINQLDYIAVENAVTALLLEFSRLYTVSEVERKFKNEILGNILQGKIIDRQKLRQIIQQLGLRENVAYQVIVLSLSEIGATNSLGYGRQAELNSMLCSAVARVWPFAHIYDQAGGIAVLFEATKCDLPGRYRKELNDAVGQIHALVNNQQADLFLTAGAGELSQGIAAVVASYRQANEALNLAGLVEQKQEPYRLVPYSDLGVIRLFLEFPQREKLREFIPTSLVKLCDYKKNQRNDLLDTLKAYLDNNQNVAKTAQVLYVHYKTVIYRIERITEIAGIDFANANEVLSVRLGMMILQILDAFGHDTISQ